MSESYFDSCPVVNALENLLDTSREFDNLIKAYEFKAAMDGKQAILEADSYKPDLVLLDVSLPEGGGGGVFKNLRQSPELREVPIIFLSAMPPAEILQMVQSDGHSTIHRKPFKAKELLDLIAKMLGG